MEKSLSMASACTAGDLGLTATYFNIPDEYKKRCVEAHHYYECGHPVQKQDNGKMRSFVRHYRHRHRFGLPCEAARCKPLRLSVPIPGQCVLGCTGVAIPRDDLDEINDRQREREEREDRELKGKDLKEALRRREERLQKAKEERELWISALAKTYEDIVIYER
ncbi:RNA polymerase II holoenzyme cyclin-like subunit [Hypoxylon texense]